MSKQQMRDNEEKNSESEDTAEKLTGREHREAKMWKI